MSSSNAPIPTPGPLIPSLPPPPPLLPDTVVLEEKDRKPKGRRARPESFKRRRTSLAPSVKLSGSQDLATFVSEEHQRSGFQYKYYNAKKLTGPVHAQRIWYNCSEAGRGKRGRKGCKGGLQAKERRDGGWDIFRHPPHSHEPDGAQGVARVSVAEEFNSADDHLSRNVPLPLPPAPTSPSPGSGSTRLIGAEDNTRLIGAEDNTRLIGAEDSTEAEAAAGLRALGASESNEEDAISPRKSSRRDTRSVRQSR